MEVYHILESDSLLILLQGADMSEEGRGWDHKLVEEVLPDRIRELQPDRTRIHSATTAQIVDVVAVEPSICGKLSGEDPFSSSS